MHAGKPPDSACKSLPRQPVQADTAETHLFPRSMKQVSMVMPFQLLWMFQRPSEAWISKILQPYPIHIMPTMVGIGLEEDSLSNSILAQEELSVADTALPPGAGPFTSSRLIAIFSTPATQVARLRV